jgi:glucuronoarabinoxylan endo-1,4-beta-xylanase
MTWLSDISRAAFRTLALGAAVAAGGCFDSGDRPDRVPPPPPGPVQVDLTVTHQRIDGFGASSAWTANNISDALADRFFSTETGIGLSLLRVQIKPTGTTAELGTAKKAVARGAKVWAAPWTPPLEWRMDADACGYAGSLVAANRQDWANRLASFAGTMAAEGVPLVAISAQNEPNYAARAKVANGVLDCKSGWDSCVYTSTELVTFIRDFLGPALVAQGLNVPIMAPETQGWDQFSRFAGPLLADAAVVGMLGPIATHHYGGTPYDYAPAKDAGKVLWQTEVSDDGVETLDRTIDSGIRTAAMIHDNLVLGNVSAWHYWWLVPASNNGNGGLTADGALLPRAWVLGNWSRFVRPGFVRVDATPINQDYVYVTAFLDSAGGRVVLVAINQWSTDLSQDFTIAGGTVSELAPWITAAGKNLEPQAVVPVVDGKFSVVLPARSVTSFVGTVQSR